MRKIVDPLSPTGEERDIASVLYGLAAQENCDGEPYDQMQAADEYIRELEENVDFTKRANKEGERLILWIDINLVIYCALIVEAVILL